MARNKTGREDRGRRPQWAALTVGEKMPLWGVHFRPDSVKITLDRSAMTDSFVVLSEAPES